MRINPEKILCAVDFFEYSESIISYSEALCKVFNAKLYLCHVTMDIMPLFGTSETTLDPVLLQESHIENARDDLQALGDRLSVPHELLITKGDPATRINELARKHGIEMVVTATHGKSGMKRLLIGSVTERLMKTIECPLLILHTREHDFIPFPNYNLNLNKILVGCDFSPDSSLAFQYGLSLAQEFQAELHLAHVIKPAEDMAEGTPLGIEPGDYFQLRSHHYMGIVSRNREDQEKRVKGLRDTLKRQLFQMVPEESQNWCTPTTVLLDGTPHEELVEYARIEKIDMIVLGVRGHSLLEKLMVGSTTDRVVRKSLSPVLVVRKATSQ